MLSLNLFNMNNPAWAWEPICVGNCPESDRVKKDDDRDRYGYTEPKESSTEKENRHLRRGNQYYDSRNWKAAEKEYRKAIYYRPDWHSFHYSLGNALYRQGRYSEAEESYSKAISLDPENVSYHNWHGVTLKKLGRYKEAEAEYHTAIRLDPTDTNYQNNLINLINSRKEHVSSSSFERALYLGKSNNYLRAEKEYRKYLLINPKSFGAYNNLGNQLDNQKRYLAAEAAYREAIRLDPSDSVPRNNLKNLIEGHAYKNALKQLIAAKKHGELAAAALSVEAMKDRAMDCFDRGCTYITDHSIETVVFAPRKSDRFDTAVPAEVKKDPQFKKLKRHKEKLKKEYKETYDALEAAWEQKDQGKSDNSTIGVVIAELKQNLTNKTSEIRFYEIKLEDRCADLGVVLPNP